jgi:hypothetical protein
VYLSLKAASGKRAKSEQKFHPWICIWHITRNNRPKQRKGPSRKIVIMPGWMIRRWGSAASRHIDFEKILVTGGNQTLTFLSAFSM